jgi:hypothetical protein
MLFGSAVVPHWKTTWDSATYIALAESLIRGDGYTYNGYPHTKYPPGFPLLLVPVELLFGRDFFWMRALIAACGAGSVGATYFLIRRRATAVYAVAVCVMTTASYALVFETTRILSDVPYMLVSLVALLWGERAVKSASRRDLSAAILLIVLAWTIRLVGFTLAPALAIPLLFQRTGAFRERALRAGVVVGVVGMVIAVWMARNALVTRTMPDGLRESLSYEAELAAVNPDDPQSKRAGFAEIGQRVSRNAIYYEGMLSDLLTARKLKDATWRHALAAIWLLGWMYALVKRRSIVEFATLFYVGVYLLWPSVQGDRFLVPILPMLFYYALQPIEAVADGIRRLKRDVGLVIEAAGQVALAAFVVWLNASLVSPMIRRERQEPYYDPATQDYMDAIAWTRDHTPSDAVIITDRAPYAVLFAGRRAFTSPWVADQQTVLDAIAANGGTHVIANDVGYSPKYLLPVIAAHPERFHEVHRIGQNVIYEVLR